jgi:hypothetical protein
MSDIAVQASFNSGEWAPALYARVDIQKYRSAAALLENFFVDYRGGASSRAGTAYINQAYKSSTAVRLIRFQASFSVGYILEFGDLYIRFYFQGKAVLETGFTISAASQANPAVITVVGNDFVIGDWIFISGIGGMTELDGLFFSVLNVVGSAVTLGDLNGNPIDSTTFPAYTSGGLAQRDYTLPSPFAAADLALVKFAVSTDIMVLAHPSYPTQVLTLNSATNWTIAAATFGSTAQIPTGLVSATTLGAGNVNYSYGVTSIDSNGQESNLSAPVSLLSLVDIRSVAGSNSVTYNSAPGAIAYNVYESELSYFGVVPSNVQYGFIGTLQGTQFIDSNIGPDFSLSPPIAQDPFLGSGIASAPVTVRGTYTSVPGVAFGGSPTVSAAATATLIVTGAAINNAGTGFSFGDTVTFPNGVIGTVNGTAGAGSVTSISFFNKGAINSGPVPANPVSPVSTSGSGHGLNVNFTWGVGYNTITFPGQGYPSAPPVVYTPAGASATAILAPPTMTNPSVPSFFQERLILAAPTSKPETFWCSKPGSFFNFDISLPANPSDAITATIVSGELNTIKAIVPSAAGMLMLTDKASWLVNGGSSGSAITPSAIVANAQSFIGANDVPPIVANYDVLYVQSKGAGIRDLAFNIYFSVFTGTDISILSSHLFYGFEILEWAWAESPFYVVWAVRDDGVMLSLTYLKEQEFIGWAHHTTQGDFVSVASVTEATDTIPNVDAVYVVVERVVNGHTVKYIERMAERIFPNIDVMGWCVDAGISYSGAPATTFSGANHLAGLTVTGVADGIVIPPFTMSVTGTFTLGTPATDVIVGLSFEANLQTLPLDVGEPSIQGKVKKIAFANVRVNQTLGISIGPDFDHLQPMKDLIQGNVSSMLTGQESQVVSGLYSGDARTYAASPYTVPGQYCIRQSQPLPVSILGVFPAIVQGDDR